ncbi:MAG: hypothetical protein JRN20_05360 [Nitrososphaerota archaeon]|nr:hypothetical protein [Nitrososphaerota archaeon]
MATTNRRLLGLVTGLLAATFLLSAVLNLSFKIPLGFTELSFASPSESIAEFEVAIASVLIVAVVFSRLLIYGGAYLFGIVGILEGLLSSDVQGLARTMHEAMVPLTICGCALLAVEVRKASKARRYQASGQRNREIVTALQFFVGGLVTLGGAAYARSGTYPFGTALGSIHLIIGLTGLFGGYVFMRGKSWSSRFLVGINGLTIGYSAFSESLAEIFSLLPPGINDALVGTIVAIAVSATIIYMLLSNRRNGALLWPAEQTSVQL